MAGASRGEYGPVSSGQSGLPRAAGSYSLTAVYGGGADIATSASAKKTLTARK